MGNMQTSLEHLKNHVTYPTDKAGVVAACNNMQDVEATDREWFSKTLPDGNYDGAGAVLNALVDNI